MKYSSRISVTVVLAVALFAAKPAHAADDETNEVVAETLFQEGVRLVEAKRFAEGCVKLAESHRLDPQLGTLLNLADCHEKAGRIATAWSEYQKLVDLATRAGDRARVDYARTRAAALEHGLARASFVVPAEGVSSLRLDGAELGRAAWSASLPLDPGTHTLDVVATDGHTHVQHFEIVSGTTSSIAVDAPAPLATKRDATEPAAAPAPSPSPSPPPPHAPKSSLRTIGVVTAGAGAASVLTGIAFGAIALGKKSTVTQHCTGARCDETGFAAQDSAHTLATISTITVVAGGALLVGGLALALLVARPTTKSSAIVTSYPFRF